ncbi:unnamed protein product [Orchesella dallaii]|uniref:Uncharacterized protein n=1 Tax=Orchesella dallaii TaxID=48710 RepID=A0ABP1PYD8_9HEXA
MYPTADPNRNLVSLPPQHFYVPPTQSRPPPFVYAPIVPTLPDYLSGLISTTLSAHLNPNQNYQGSGNPRAPITQPMNFPMPSPPPNFFQQQRLPHISSFLEPPRLRRPPPNSTWTNQQTGIQAIQAQNYRNQPEFTLVRHWHTSYNRGFLESRQQEYPPRQVVAVQGSGFTPTGRVQHYQNQVPEFGRQSQTWREQRINNIQRFQGIGTMPGRTQGESEQRHRQVSMTYEEGAGAQPSSSQQNARTGREMTVDYNVPRKRIVPMYNEAAQQFLEEVAELRTKPLSSDEYLEMVNIVNGEPAPFYDDELRGRRRGREHIGRSEGLKLFYARVVQKRYIEKQDNVPKGCGLSYEREKNRFAKQKEQLAMLNCKEFLTYFVGVINAQNRRAEAASAIGATATLVRSDAK